jgi:hypothetical protein
MEPRTAEEAKPSYELMGSLGLYASTHGVIDYGNDERTRAKRA